MSFDRNQFEALCRRCLDDFDAGLVSDSAIHLLLGTAAQESKFGHYLRQIKGPAIGVFQMEPETFYWLRNYFAKKYPELAKREPLDMEWDLRLAVVMARLRYKVHPDPLPDAADIVKLGQYWKLVYNSPKGKGKVEEFVANYNHYVGGK